MRDWRGPLPTAEQLGSLRDHQTQLFARALGVAQRTIEDKFTVAQVTPGGGKTLAASIFAHVLLRAGIVDRVIIVVPRDTLRDQMREGFCVPERGLGLHVASAASDVSMKVVFDKAGLVTTYQAVAKSVAAQHLKAVKSCRILLILDEVHHLVDEEGKGWVPGVRALVERATHVLALSGNLGRGDEKPIPFIPYGADRCPIKHVQYSRAKALDERAIIPLSVSLQNGDTEYFDRGKEHAVELATARTKRQKSKSLATALELEEFRDRVLTTGIAAWLDYRETFYRSQLIVICDKQKDARNAASRIRAAHPAFDIALAISEEGPEAKRWLKKFRTRTGADVLVTCDMAYEGLDAPWATHMVYLSNKRSLPWMEQATARITRFNSHCGLPWDRQAAVVFAPGDARMRAFVAQLDAEQNDQYRERAERLTAPRFGRRGDFQPLNAAPTTVDVGGERGIPNPRVQEKIRELRDRYPHMHHMPIQEVQDLAEQILRLEGPLRDDEAAE